MLSPGEFNLKARFAIFPSDCYRATRREDSVIFENRFDSHGTIETLRLRDARDSNESRFVCVYRSATPEFPT